MAIAPAAAMPLLFTFIGSVPLSVLVACTDCKRLQYASNAVAFATKGGVDTKP